MRLSVVDRAKSHKELASHFEPKLTAPNIQALVTTITHVLLLFSDMQLVYISSLHAVGELQPEAVFSPTDYEPGVLRLFQAWSMEMSHV